MTDNLEDVNLRCSLRAVFGGLLLRGGGGQNPRKREKLISFYVTNVILSRFECHMS